MFVNLYQSHPILWDITSIDYKNKNRRQNALEDTVKQMDIPGSVSYTHLDVYKRQNIFTANRPIYAHNVK